MTLSNQSFFTSLDRKKSSTRGFQTDAQESRAHKEGEERLKEFNIVAVGNEFHDVFMKSDFVSGK